MPNRGRSTLNFAVLIEFPISTPALPLNTPKGLRMMKLMAPLSVLRPNSVP
jgi:hypothetical protein